MNDNGKLNHWLVLLLKRCFTLFCIFATLLAVIMQFNTYGKGEDETQVEYKQFNAGKSDVYPSIGLCLTRAINEEALEDYGENLTAQNYASFLMGQHWDESMLKVDYKNVIKHWDKHILAYGYGKNDPNTFMKIVPLYESKEIEPTSTGIMPGFEEISLYGQKCFKIDILFEKDLSLQVFWLFLKPEIFLHGRRPSNVDGNLFLENGFMVIPHYPKQILRRMSQGQVSWPARGNDAPKSYSMHFFIKSIDVLERRNKYRNPCNMDFADLDNLIKQSVLKEIGCKPPYWNSSSPLPLCNNQKEMRKANNLISKLLYSDTKRAAILKSLPCRGLERIQYDFAEEEFPNDVSSESPGLNGSLRFTFEFMESTYKELKHVRSMDLQALIGNSNKNATEC